MKFWQSLAFTEPERPERQAECEAARDERVADCQDNRDEVLQWHSKLVRAGVEIDTDIADHGAYYTFTCRDPDGHGVEIYFEEEPRGRAGFPAT